MRAVQHVREYDVSELRMVKDIRHLVFRAVMLAGMFVAFGAVQGFAATLSDYHTRVKSALDIVQSIYFDEQDDSDSKLADRVRVLLPVVETVETPSGSFEIDNAWLHSELDSFVGSYSHETRFAPVERIHTRLSTLNAHLEATLNDPQAHASEAERAKLEEILARPEFRSPGDDPIARFFRELRERISQWMIDIAKKIFGSTEGSTFNAGLRAVILAAGLVGLILLVRAIAQAAARRKGGAVRGKKTVLGEEVDESTTAADLATAAKALAAKGEYRMAIRKLFVALIYQLDEQGLVMLHSDATNREYLALVRKFGTLHPVMATMTDTFELIWYGNQQADRAAYDAFEKSHGQASSAVARLAANSPSS